MVAKKYADVYCLFHQTKGCPCVKPVMNAKTLRTRLETLIQVNKGLKDIELDDERLIQIDERIAEFQKRIDDLEDI